MPAPQVQSIEFIAPPADERGEIRVTLEDGSSSVFGIATPQRPALEVGETGFSFSSPRLFVADMNEETIGEAVAKMALDIGGFWLRYYSRARSMAAEGGGTPQKVLMAELAEAQGAKGKATGILNVRLEDGRQFSILAATPQWFEDEFKKAKLRYYWGPCVLFARTLDMALVRSAADTMAQKGDQWLCRYDTPRITLPKVLADFKAKHS